MADNTGNNSPQSAAGASQNSPVSATTPTPGDGKAKGKGKELAAKKGKDAGGTVLSPALQQQVRSILDNHGQLQREADNNVPFTSHMLSLAAVPGVFRGASVDATQVTSFINTEAGKVRAHLAVVQQVRDATSDADAKRRLTREVELLEGHIKLVNNFMRVSFHSALSGNPAALGGAGKEARPRGAAEQAAAAGSRPGTPAALTPYVLGAKARGSTHVPLSSALAHVATQSTRASGPVDLDGGTRILSKRKIQALVSEIDAGERLEPDVEDILCDIADEFIESVTAFACQLAKHRKSDTLEAKDLQLHLERNWNIRIPGFAAEEIRSVRKSAVSQAHQEKLAAITNTRNLRKFD